ncbi:uncharacterized protein LOC101721641 [Heterocephalus glaber]|uniref:Uncharacterized protein LOC101721641 n=1 Tax=Heterocephalus glaber TaxID=10181 RepID=A0AAX6NSR9_HETGA|nr:uncharacterized protein LOC101721641 [Heterocephalus glaber]
MPMAPTGSQRDWSGMQIRLHSLQVCLRILLLTNHHESSLGELFWTYVLDPPMAHPHSWEDGGVMVWVNDTRWLGKPALARGENPEQKGINYTGVGVGTPICFSHNHSSFGCLTLGPQLLVEKGRDDCPSVIHDVFLVMPVGSEADGTVPQEYPPCGQGQCINETVPWERCMGNTLRRYNITGFTTYILDWSASRLALNEPSSPSPEGPIRPVSAGLWWTYTGYSQPYIWKIAAAFAQLDGKTGSGRGQMLSRNVTVSDGR